MRWTQGDFSNFPVPPDPIFLLLCVVCTFRLLLSLGDAYRTHIYSHQNTFCCTAQEEEDVRSALSGHRGRMTLKSWFLVFPHLPAAAKRSSKRILGSRMEFLRILSLWTCGKTQKYFFSASVHPPGPQKSFFRLFPPFPPLPNAKQIKNPHTNKKSNQRKNPFAIFSNFFPIAVRIWQIFVL